MKVCSHCGSTFSERIDFCFYDGSVLEADEAAVPGGDDAMDLPSPKGFDLPMRRAPGAPREADLTPVPLKPMRLPVGVRGARPAPEPLASPLVAPPPPPAPTATPEAPVRVAGGPAEAPVHGAGAPADAPVHGEGGRDAADGLAEAPGADATPPPPGAAEAPPAEEAFFSRSRTPEPEPREASPAESGSTDDSDDEGMPPWVWWAFGGVAGALLIGAGLFALTSLGFFTAAATLKPDGEPTRAHTEPAEAAAPDDTERFPAEPDTERFPEPPLEVGVVAQQQDSDDSDAELDDGAAEDTDALVNDGGDSGVEEQGGGEAGTPEDDRPRLTVGVVTPEPAPGEAGTPVDEAAGQGSDAGGQAPAPTPAPPDEPENPWGATDDAGSAAAADPLPVPAKPAPAPAAGSVQVQVVLQGSPDGVTLFVDDALAVGGFPHSLSLTPGVHRFRVTGPDGNSYEIGKTIRDGDSDVRITLIPPR